jgi:hypothetical protein
MVSILNHHMLGLNTWSAPATIWLPLLASSNRRCSWSGNRLRMRAAKGGRRRRDGLLAAERDESARRRRESKQLRSERDILSRAAARFAREISAIPLKSLGS